MLVLQLRYIKNIIISPLDIAFIAKYELHNHFHRTGGGGDEN